MLIRGRNLWVLPTAARSASLDPSFWPHPAPELVMNEFELDRLLSLLGVVLAAIALPSSAAVILLAFLVGLLIGQARHNTVARG